jgi:hypothetical protein
MARIASRDTLAPYIRSFDMMVMSDQIMNLLTFAQTEDADSYHSVLFPYKRVRNQNIDNNLCRYDISTGKNELKRRLILYSISPLCINHTRHTPLFLRNIPKTQQGWVLFSPLLCNIIAQTHKMWRTRRKIEKIMCICAMALHTGVKILHKSAWD